MRNDHSRQAAAAPKQRPAKLALAQASGSEATDSEPAQNAPQLGDTVFANTRNGSERVAEAFVQAYAQARRCFAT